MTSAHADLRFLQEAARLGEVTVLLWPDETLRQITGKPPKLPLAERSYFLEAVRYVTRVFRCPWRHPADAQQSCRTSGR